MAPGSFSSFTARRSSMTASSTFCIGISAIGSSLLLTRR